MATRLGAPGAALLPYWAFLRASFLKMLAYRLRYWTGVFSYLIYVSTYYFLWRAIYAARPEGIRGFDLGAMITYVAIGWIARSFYFNNVDRELADLVAEGEIALALARPVSFQGMLVAGAFGESLFRLLFFTGPIALVLFLLYPIAGPASPGAALAFALSALLALAIFVHLNFLVGLSAIRLKSIQGVIRAKHYLIEILSGLVLPVTFFPAWLEGLSRCLPFQAMAFIPGSIYLGRLTGRSLVVALATQAGWAAALALSGALVWRRVARTLTVQGG